MASGRCGWTGAPRGANTNRAPTPRSAGATSPRSRYGRGRNSPLHPRVIEQRMRSRPGLAHRSPDGTQGGLDRASGLVRVGVTDFAQQTLGDVIDVARPGPGETVQAGQTCGDIEQPDHREETAGPMPDSVSVPELLRTRQRSVGGPLRPDQVLLGRRRVVLRDGEEGEEEGGFRGRRSDRPDRSGGVGRRPAVGGGLFGNPDGTSNSPRDRVTPRSSAPQVRREDAPNRTNRRESRKTAREQPSRTPVRGT
ncbi:hypothetical protein ACFXC8_30145 [Streptomyces sp. NPDC059441]|uniref:hypothetical protein n=2 Tax=unclassified Streptomyces TaxID=2593676 RepID=UPI0036A2ED2B